MIEKAFAKVNLFLNVVGKREDGYHELNMVTHPIELHDLLKFEHSENVELIGSAFSDDIILRTVKLVRETFNISKGVKITLSKRIPVGAGLGGGSADAAATLRGLNRLYELNLSLDQLAALGVKLGADVPMCIYNKPAIVKGIGERVEFIDSIEGELLLALPEEHISTADVFSQTHLLNMEYKSELSLVNALKKSDIEAINKLKKNDLEKVTLSVSLGCREVAQILKKINPYFMMTGSGSVFYNVYGDSNELKRNAEELDRYAIKWLRSHFVCNL